MSGRASGPTGPDGSVGPVAWIGVGLVCLCAAMAGMFEALLTPLYLGRHEFPIAVLVAIVSNIVFPLMARTLVPTLAGTGLPFLAWLIVLIGFGVIARPEGDVILPGGSLQLVSYGVMLGGALAGVVTVVTSAPARPPTPTTNRTANRSREVGHDGSVR